MEHEFTPCLHERLEQYNEILSSLEPMQLIPDVDGTGTDSLDTEFPSHELSIVEAFANMLVAREDLPEH